MLPTMSELARTLVEVASAAEPFPVGFYEVKMGAPCPDGCIAPASVRRHRVRGAAEVAYVCGTCCKRWEARVDFPGEVGSEP